jgi:hypothetical protein
MVYAIGALRYDLVPEMVPQALIALHRMFIKNVRFPPKKLRDLIEALGERFHPNG